MGSGEEKPVLDRKRIPSNVHLRGLTGSGAVSLVAPLTGALAHEEKGLFNFTMFLLVIPNRLARWTQQRSSEE